MRLDPKIFKILEQNISINSVQGVELVNKAVWSSDAFVEFSVEGADGGRIRTGSDVGCIRIPAVSLESIFRGSRFDFVKIDIEGAEIEG